MAEEAESMNPYDCHISCLKMDILQPGKSFTVALSKNGAKMMCHCGLDFDEANLEDAGKPACTLKCSDDSPCGGPAGQLSVYKSFKAKAANTLTVTPVNLKEENVTKSTSEKITVGEVWKIRLVSLKALLQSLSTPSRSAKK